MTDNSNAISGGTIVQSGTGVTGATNGITEQKVKKDTEQQQPQQQKNVSSLRTRLSWICMSAFVITIVVLTVKDYLHVSDIMFITLSIGPLLWIYFIKTKRLEKLVEKASKSLHRVCNNENNQIWFMKKVFPIFICLYLFKDWLYLFYSFFYSFLELIYITSLIMKIYRITLVKFIIALGICNNLLKFLISYTDAPKEKSNQKGNYGSKSVASNSKNLSQSKGNMNGNSGSKPVVISSSVASSNKNFPKSKGNKKDQKIKKLDDYRNDGAWKEFYTVKDWRGLTELLEGCTSLKGLKDSFEYRGGGKNGKGWYLKPGLQISKSSKTSSKKKTEASDKKKTVTSKKNEQTVKPNDPTEAVD